MTVKLIRAIESGNLTKAEHLLSQGEDINYLPSVSDGGGDTLYSAVYTVVRKKDLLLLHWLLKNGADPNVVAYHSFSEQQQSRVFRDDRERSDHYTKFYPLGLAVKMYLSAQRNNPQVLRMIRSLLAAGADLHRGYCNVDLTKEPNLAHLFFYEALWRMDKEELLRLQTRINKQKISFNEFYRYCSSMPVHMIKHETISLQLKMIREFLIELSDVMSAEDLQLFKELRAKDFIHFIDDEPMCLDVFSNQAKTISDISLTSLTAELQYHLGRLDSPATNKQSEGFKENLLPLEQREERYQLQKLFDFINDPLARKIVSRIEGVRMVICQVAVHEGMNPLYRDRCKALLSQYEKDRDSMVEEISILEDMEKLSEKFEILSKENRKLKEQMKTMSTKLDQLCTEICAPQQKIEQGNLRLFT